MKVRNHLLPLAVLSLLMVSRIASAGFGVEVGTGNRVHNRSPFQLGPCSDKAHLKGMDPVEFRWRPTRPGSIFYTDFELYRGYQTTEENRIFKQKVEGGASVVRVPGKTLTAGHTYTWMIQEAYLGGHRGERAFCSFTVEK